MDPVEVVRQGYNKVARDYLRERLTDGADIRMLDELESRLAGGATVLDLGCGAGQPIAARLAKSFEVTGLDISESQLQLAREAVPSARFILANMVTQDLGEALYDGVCSYYAIIHVPREHHRDILAKISRALKPGGVALLCLGANDIEEDYDDCFGTTMFWSHFDSQTYLAILPELGFEIEINALVRDESWPEAKHLFVLVRKPRA
ncbi:MAG TPA: class I SAM-dependent methyltransferase [Fimbriimonadaceae bacterium]|nr:class I SAM-dependent methyltransferase [Fimbriimonadaceae bacterium]